MHTQIIARPRHAPKGFQLRANVQIIGPGNGIPHSVRVAENRFSRSPFRWTGPTSPLPASWWPPTCPPPRPSIGAPQHRAWAQKHQRARDPRAPRFSCSSSAAGVASSCAWPSSPGRRGPCRRPAPPRPSPSTARSSTRRRTPPSHFLLPHLRGRALGVARPAGSGAGPSAGVPWQAAAESEKSATSFLHC